MNNATPHPEPTHPHPPRYWWLRRIAGTWIVALIMLAGLRVWWGRDAQRRLDSAIAQIHARGGKILPAEFADPHVDDANNVVWYLNRAAASLNEAAVSPSASSAVYREYLPMQPEWVIVARKAVEGNAKSLQLARQAREHSKVDWGLTFDSPLFKIMLPMLNQQRALANLLGDTAVYRHTTGDDTEALESLMDLYHAADAVDRQPFLVSHLVSIGINALATVRLEMLSPELRIDDEAQRSRVRAMIALLLDRSRPGGMVRSFEGERMGQVDRTNLITRRSLLLRPMYQLDAIQMMRGMDQQIAAATQPSFAAAMNSLPAPGTLRSGKASQLVSSLLVPSLNRALETDFRIRMETTLATVCLAVRMYRVDHEGAFPPNLAAMVPDYLPSVPVDPMSPTGAAVGYVFFNNRARPMVYSVGRDEVDDTVKNNATPGAMPHAGWDNSSSDQWRDLSHIDPPPPTTNPGDNDFSEPQER